ncbi:M56 family metallopeptidase [Undibacterium cyanobacteriorum]|uniref:M56 family metallopeptidase n=1 Tax=Undibacterium cyanobacteriorum TaxID=3073561 RepID=A0ABY9RKN1_9BURK|nr:M56 family metallopeptidase [Undibacterium sp. 20NA77.5]WMW80907.1 M56 family metallopeptidase [Undibacterium sp. 20NA77.5]
MQQDLLLNFLLAYCLHSSVLLACAAVVHRSSYLRHHRMAEMIWRLALFGALVTAGLQAAWNHSHTEQTPVDNSIQRSLAISAPRDVNTETLPTKLSTTAPTHQALAASEFRSADSTAITAISLSNRWQFFTQAVLAIWCAIAVFSIISVVVSVRYLNRKINSMPKLKDEDLQQFAKRLSLSNKTIVIRTGDAWQSPLLAPNVCVFLPAWALSTLTKDQCKAMLAHEVAHWRRADHRWRIAYQLMRRFFFFQIFNRYALAQLDLLAEFDCDRAALQHQTLETYTETLLECAQRQITAHPQFALAMARPSSLSQRVHSLIKEDNMRTSTLSRKVLLVFGVFAITGLSAVSYAIPRFVIATNKAPYDDSRMNLHQRQLTTNTATLEKTAEVTPVSPSNALAKEPNAKPAAQGSAVTPPTLTSEAVSDTRLSQAHQAWKDHPAYAFKLFAELANEGVAEAQEALGEMFWYGEGTTADQKAARLWLSKAAMQGRTRAHQFIEMFAERDRRQSEIRFYTEEFDGGNLKWEDKVCPAPDLSESNMGVTQLKTSLQALNKKIDCYNQYVSTMKTSLQTLSFIPEDLRRLMREEEIGRARALAEDRYYEFAVKEKSVNEALQMTLSQRYAQQARNAESTRDNFDANGYWPWRANYDRQQTPQMTTNPKSEPVSERAGK